MVIRVRLGRGGSWAHQSTHTIPIVDHNPVFILLIIQNFDYFIIAIILALLINENC